VEGLHCAVVAVLLALVMVQSAAQDQRLAQGAAERAAMVPPLLRVVQAQVVLLFLNGLFEFGLYSSQHFQVSSAKGRMDSIRSVV
jgi:hypothetical protein